MVNEEKKEDILKQGNISLVLQDYNDIFSDFDPRTYSDRALSDDFLSECKKAARNKEAEVELRLLMPKIRRNLNDEFKIKKRLKSHFEHHFKEKELEIKKIRNQGISWFIIGAILMMVATFLKQMQSKNFLIILLEVMLEPAGWFSFWEGLVKVLITSGQIQPEYEFYRKMARANIGFFNY